MSDRISTLAGKCPCGRPFARVGQVEGREEDVLQVAARAGRTAAIHPNVFHGVLELAPVSAWQVVQEEDGVLRVLVAAPATSFDEQRTRLELARALEDAGAVAPRIAIESVDAIPRTALGKAPLIRRSHAQR